MLSQAQTMPTGFAAPKSDGFFTLAYRSLRARYIAYKTRQALLGLSPRELDDIGLSAGDIDRVAYRSIGL